MTRPHSHSSERVLAAVEIAALAGWASALAAFAFAFAPHAFALIAPLDVMRFSTLVVRSLGTLTRWGYALGGITLAVAALRALRGGLGRPDAVRAVLVLIALPLSFYHQHVVVQRMLAVTDVRSPAYHALHARSTQIYGSVLLLLLAAMVLAALRPTAR